MREIKFRAWNRIEKRMESVNSIRFFMYQYTQVSTRYHDVKSGKSVDNQSVYGHEDGGDNIILMQYTGLKDKNGKEIYEGDIFHLGDRNILYVVEWHDCGLMGRQCRTHESYVGLTYWQDRIEVIGNIHDNPELLKGKSRND